MFTVEHDYAASVITVLDMKGEMEDVEFNVQADVIYIRQFNEERGEYDLIEISPLMMSKFLTAFNLPEGAYYQEKENPQKIFNPFEETDDGDA